MTRIALVRASVDARVWIAFWSVLSFLVLATVVLGPAETAHAGEPSAATMKIVGTERAAAYLGGTFQPRASWGRSDAGDDDRLGFGLRRARLRAYVTIGERTDLRYDVDLRGGALESVDLYAAYRFAEGWRMRVGYFAGAQPAAYIPTSHTRIDGIDRAAIGERWSALAFGTRGRDFGIDVRRATDQLQLELWLHNGDGNFDASRGNFRQSISSNDATRSVDQTTLAVSGTATLTPQSVDGLELGLFGGYNGARSPYTAPEADAPGRSYGTWSAHAYWGADPGSQPVRLKAEILGLHYESGTLADGTAVPTRAILGWALFAATRVFDHGEVFARYEEFDADEGGGADSYWTAGASYSFSAARGDDYREQRLTLAYNNALPGSMAAGDEHQVVLQWQYVF